MTWYVLRSAGGYLGKQWQMAGSLNRPRMALFPTLDAPASASISLCHGVHWTDELAGQAGGVFGLEFVAVPVSFEGTGRGTKIEIMDRNRGQG